MYLDKPKKHTAKVHQATMQTLESSPVSVVNCHDSYLQHRLRFHLNPITQSRPFKDVALAITSMMSNSATHLWLFVSFLESKQGTEHIWCTPLAPTRSLTVCLAEWLQGGATVQTDTVGVTPSPNELSSWSRLCVLVVGTGHSHPPPLWQHNDKDYLWHIFSWPVHILLIVSLCYCEPAVLGRLLVTDSSRHLIKWKSAGCPDSLPDTKKNWWFVAQYVYFCKGEQLINLL